MMILGQGSPIMQKATILKMCNMYRRTDLRWKNVDAFTTPPMADDLDYFHQTRNP